MPPPYRLSLLFPLPGMYFPKTPTWLIPSPLSSLISHLLFTVISDNAIWYCKLKPPFCPRISVYLVYFVLFFHSTFHLLPCHLVYLVFLLLCPHPLLCEFQKGRKCSLVCSLLYPKHLAQCLGQKKHSVITNCQMNGFSIF